VQSQHNTNSATQGLKILIAGCGTGHEPAIYANSMPGVHITAIDLSPPSIAYGKRMAIQLGIDKNIDFMHGDLMNVGDLHQSFDLVTSSGVLHHLKDPEKGLTAILKTLKPNGRLSISLYSKAARDYALNPALSYIREKGYTSSTDDIRQFRRDIMLMSPDNLATRCATAGDFFFLSECNDLLFHVQEHRYTPHMIWEMAERHNLIPIHISMTPDVLKLFKELFPDQSPLNPTLLEKFEDAHPKVFIEMYKIFFRRKENDEPSPLDSFIMSGLL
jgi:SAM-dependent methyltransferase